MPKIARRKKELSEKNPRLGTIPKVSIKMSKSWIFIALFIVAYVIFYLLLRDKLPFTPDFQGSDAFHINVSLKYYLWQSIRSGILPFWTDKLVGGFPLIAESQIGAFFLPHFLVFPFFSVFSHAYMFLFAFHLFLLSVGMFMVLRFFKIPSVLSFLLALTFTWCGAVSFRWVHFNFIQTFSLCPFLFLSYLKWNVSQKKRYALISSFLICQMIFAGHMQTTFNFIFALCLLHVLLNFPINVKKYLSFFSFILLGFVLAAPQIIPTLLLSQFSQRTIANVYQYVVYLLYTSKDLIGFYSSNALGSPQYASYTIGSAGNRVYWENTPYLGELFVIVLFFGSIIYFVQYKKQSFVRFFLLLFFVFLLLAFGGDSPIYFVFGMFPFNMFRTPSKYLLESVFFLILYAAFIFKNIIKNRLLLFFVYVALTVNCFILIQTAFSYHVFIDSQILMNSLNTFSNVVAKSTYFNPNGFEKWYRTFKEIGWNDKKDIDTYLFLNSGLLPNSNLITGVSTFDIDTGGLRMRRNDFIQSIVSSTLSEFTDNQQSSEDVGIRFEKFLHLYNIGTIITFQPIYLPHYSLVKMQKNDKTTMTIFQDTLFKSSTLFVPSKVTSFTYIEDIEKELEKETVSEANSFTEGLSKEIVQDSQNSKFDILKNSDQYFSAIISTREKKFFVAKKGWYPEWKLFIDGKENKIYKTNLIQMGFYVPAGTHTIELRYVPTSFYIGCLIAVLGLMFPFLWVACNISEGLK